MKPLFKPTKDTRSISTPLYKLDDGTEGKPKFAGIYQISIRDDDRVYIGASINIWQRWKGHRNSLRRREHHSPKLQGLWDQKGSECFELKVLEVLDRDADMLQQREQYWIDYFAALNLSLNALSTAVYRGVWTEEQKVKVSAGHWTKSRITDELVAKMRQRLDAGELPGIIAKEFGLSSKSARKIFANKTRPVEGRTYISYGFGEKHSHAIVKEQDVIKIRQMKLEGFTTRAIAERFPIEKSTVRAIVTGESWAHVKKGPPPIVPKTNEKRDLSAKPLRPTKCSKELVIEMVALSADGKTTVEISERFGMSYSRVADILAVYRARTEAGLDPWQSQTNPAAKLTADQVIEIRRRYDEGERSATKLSEEFGIHLNHICGILSGRTWKHLPFCKNPPRTWKRGQGVSRNSIRRRESKRELVDQITGEIAG